MALTRRAALKGIAATAVGTLTGAGAYDAITATRAIFLVADFIFIVFLSPVVTAFAAVRSRLPSRFRELTEALVRIIR